MNHNYIWWISIFQYRLFSINYKAEVCCCCQEMEISCWWCFTSFTAYEAVSLYWWCFVFQLTRVDVSNVSPGDPREAVDTAVKVTFTPQNVGHMLVTTSNNRLIKLDHSGRMVAEVCAFSAFTHQKKITWFSSVSCCVFLWQTLQTCCLFLTVTAFTVL